MLSFGQSGAEIALFGIVDSVWHETTYDAPTFLSLATNFVAKGSIEYYLVCVLLG